MYSPDQIRKGIQNPQLIKLEFYNKAFALYDRFFIDHQGENFIEKDWDNIILLDACRYDVFEELNTIPGTLGHAISPKGGSEAFYKYHFEEKTFEDIVVVTANPHLAFVDCEFHDVIHLWDKEWDDELNTVWPGDVTRRAIEAHEKYPNKRLFIHYVQPHTPFLGPTGEKVRHEGFRTFGDYYDVPPVYKLVARGEEDYNKVWKAYKENLELALPHVEELLEELDGKSVITADHGDAFGEWGQYGHGAMYIEPIVKVPWHMIESGPRKDIVKEGPTVNSLKTEHEKLDDHLRALGYT